MDMIYILIVVIGISTGPQIFYHEVNSLDTCKSMSIEVKRMIEKVYNNQDHKPNIMTYCHPKEIK